MGDNPLQLLYSQLSIGIHKLDEEECFDKAKSIDTVLKFVINKINSEKKNKSGAMEAIKNLKK